MSKFGSRLQRGASRSAEPELYLTPASGNLTNGSTLVLTIRENSYGAAVNAVQANLTYPTNRMTFQSISTANSNFTTTMQGQGGAGSVQIGVGLLGSSLTGDQEVARVTFTLTGAGSAAIAFAAGSGIAQSSDSTDICKKRTGSSYTIS